MKHKDSCKKESDPRKVKVKEERKVRKEAEKTRVGNCSTGLVNRVAKNVKISTSTKK